MKGIVTVIALAVLLLSVSTASAHWGYRVYYPVAPVYAYAAPVAVPVAPVVAPAPVVATAPVVYPYPAAVVRGRVYYYGEPVRNVVRVVLP